MVANKAAQPLSAEQLAQCAARARVLEARILAQLPLARAMQVRMVGFDGERVILAAPLAENINDKGTGFAGSLATLATLAGWCLVTLLSEQAGARCEAAIYRSEIDFRRPVREELRAEAWVSEAAAVARLHERLEAGKRARLSIAARLGPEADPALLFAGHYAVWRTGTQPF